MPVGNNEHQRIDDVSTYLLSYGHNESTASPTKLDGFWLVGGSFLTSNMFGNVII